MSPNVCRGDENTPVGRRIQVVGMFSAFFFAGLLTTVTGPALPNIKEALGVSEGDLGLAFLGATALSVAGAALAPGLERRLGQGLAIGGALLLCAVSTALTLALSRLFLVFAALQALSLFALSLATTLMVSRLHALWGEQVAAPLHFVSSGTGFGSLTVPVLVLPFALPPACLSNHTALPGLGELPLNNASSDNRTIFRPDVTCTNDVYLAYVIIGFMVVPVGILFLYTAHRESSVTHSLDSRQIEVYGTFEQDTPRTAEATFIPLESLPENHSHFERSQEDGSSTNNLPNEEEPFQPWRYRLLVLLMGLANLATFGAIAAFTNFLTSVGMELFALSQGTIGLMTSVVLASFTLSRVLSACLSVWVTPGTLVTGSLGGLLGAGMFLEGCGRRGEPALWVGAVIWSTCVAPSFGGLFSWGQSHISMTTSAVAFLMVFESAGLPALSAVVGGLVQWLGPHGLTVYALALPIYMIAVFTTMNILVSLK